MRRFFAVVAAATLFLSGCSADEGPQDGDSTPEDVQAPEVVVGVPGEDLPLVEGAFGEAPILSFPDADAPEDLTIAVVHEGDGAEIESGAVLISHYQVGIWGEEPVQSSFTAPTPSAFSLDRLIPGWRYGLLGTHVGDRVVLSIPSEYAYAEGNADLGVEPGDVLVFVVDLLDARMSDDFVGEATPLTGQLPEGITISAEPGTPAIPVIGEVAAAPTEIEVYVLSEGTGTPITAGDVFVAAYGASTWSNAPFGTTWSDVSWDGEPDSYGAQPPLVIAAGSGTAFDELIGVPVGSRVLFLFPANDESGTESQAVLADIVSLL
ncbi:MAG: FKBP-type peptidyl-prolyl cis-trans isomerase [Ruaniaceae bacterium]|nr:FKBP-type peptidyl-prolyl cis-trans isomerase [Ruaniaceae bacterium]